MLFPDEMAQRTSATASLFCAITSFRCVAVDTIQNGAKRYSFGRKF